MPGADGSYTPAEAASRMQERARHLTDLTPLMRAQAAKMQRATDRAFQAQRSPAGEPFPPLAASTVAARTGAQSFRKGNRGGGFLRGKASGSSVLALLKTRRMQRETKYIAKPSTIELATVPYMGPHASGAKNGRPPKRNVLVYERNAGQLVLIPEFAASFRAAFIAYVETGKVA